MVQPWCLILHSYFTTLAIIEHNAHVAWTAMIAASSLETYSTNSTEGEVILGLKEKNIILLAS